MITPTIHKPVVAALLLTAFAFNPLFAKETAKPSPPVEEEIPVVQLAILLDTSGSMQGLISQAKTQLWKIVNEFISAKQNGKTPVVQVALYEYGNSSANKKDHYIRQLIPLSRDLDTVSEKLFELTTNGGEEYCGAVIRECTKNLGWDPSPKTYKAIFIAGNEPFTQGPVNAIKACSNAIKNGIIVNTIHCGSDYNGRKTKWAAGADAADGKYLVIDHNQSVTDIETPHDKEIEKLNEELNRTYIYYGRKGLLGKEKQIMQDRNAKNAAPAAVQARIVTKASSNYTNSSWDVVDASKQKGFDISKIKDADLPEEMKTMTLEERKAYVAKMAANRTEIQAKIREAGKKRAAFIAEKAKESGKEDTLGDAISTAVREQAGKKAIIWKK